MVILIMVCGLATMFAVRNQVIDPGVKLIFCGMFLIALAIGGTADRIGKEIKDAFGRIIFSSERSS